MLENLSRQKLCPFYLEHFYLAGGPMETPQTVDITLRVGFHLDAEGNTLFSSMLLWSELGTDAIYLNKKPIVK